MARADRSMAPDKLNAMLRSMSARLAGEPAHQPILQQLNVLLDSPQRFLPAANLLGRMLVDAGLLPEAAEFYRKLADHFPNKPAGLVGMAQVAMQQRAWLEALTLWDEVVTRFSDRLTAYWLDSRAISLMELQRFDEAEDIFRGLTRDFHTDWHGFVGLARLAMLRGLWTDALTFWDEVFSRFSDQAKPYWHAGRANTLVHIDRLDEAESIFQRLADAFPTHSQGFVGLAAIAMKRHRSQDALSRWDDLIARFRGPVHSNWQASRAQVLLELGRADEAEAICRQMIRSTPESLLGLLGLLRVLVAKGKPKEAAFELESSAFGSLDVPPVIEKKFDILIGLKRFADARAEFQRLLLNNTEPAILDVLFAYTAPLHNRWQRTETFLTLLRKVESLAPQPDSRSPAVPGLLARILLALQDYSRFLALVAKTGECDLGEHWRGLLAVASKLRAPSFPDYQAVKIFGIGPCRTGTTSLAAALASLGFHALDWVNPLTRDLMSEDDVHLFDAFTDAPACASFEKYYFMFPNSKFIYTVRSLQSWKKSMNNLFSRIYGYSSFKDLKVAMAQSELVHYGADFSDIYLSLYFNHESYEDAYRIYDQRVRRFFADKPKDRFLEFDVFAGRWEDLCAFTGREKPSSPFPWLNRKL
jgi:tetratricopeptide (TPR) repeat protein